MSVSGRPTTEYAYGILLCIVTTLTALVSYVSAALDCGPLPSSLASPFTMVLLWLGMVR